MVSMSSLDCEVENNNVNSSMGTNTNENVLLNTNAQIF